MRDDEKFRLFGSFGWGGEADIPKIEDVQDGPRGKELATSIVIPKEIID